MRIAVETKRLEEWRSALRRIEGVFTDPQLHALLENPKAPFVLKKQLLEEKLKGLDPLVINLASLLVVKARTRLIGQITAEYEVLLNRQYGIEPARVTTAVPIDDEEKARLAQRLSALTGKKVAVKLEVEPDLVGGIVARIGDKLIDGSIRNRLALLKNRLAT